MLTVVAQPRAHDRMRVQTLSLRWLLNQKLNQSLKQKLNQKLNQKQILMLNLKLNRRLALLRQASTNR